MRTVFATLFLAACASVLPIGGSTAQEVRELTPEESVRLGLERNTGLRVAAADAAEALAVYREARAGRMPSVLGRGNAARLNGNIPELDFQLPGLDSTFTLLPVERNRVQFELQVDQPVFDGFRTRNQIRAAEHLADAASWMEAQHRAAIAFEIRQAFWTLHQATSVREALDASLVLMEEHVRDVRTRVEAGTALRGDLLSAQTQRSEVLLERVEADNAVRVAGLELNRLIGLPLATPVRPAADLQVEAAPAAALDSVVAFAIGASPRLNALFEQREALESQVRSARGERLPTLGLFARYLLARPNPYFYTEQDEFRSTWEVGLAAQWRLWEGGRQGARLGQVRARLSAAEARLAEAREQMVVEVTRQYLEVRRSAEAVAVATQATEEAEEALRVVRRQYDEGVALSSQVLDAEQAYRNARARHARSLAEHAIARAHLLSVAGRVQ